MQFLGFTMPCMNALFPLLLEVHGAVCKCFNGVDLCIFFVFYMFMMQFFSASMGESYTVYGSFHAVHAFTLPPSLDVHAAVFKCFNSGERCSFWDLLYRA